MKGGDPFWRMSKERQYNQLVEEYKQKERMAEITHDITEYWEFWSNDNIDRKEHDAITGKYLFFSRDRKKLQAIALWEVENNGFPEAKINLEHTKIGSDYVLCLYYKNNSRRIELAERYKEHETQEPPVRYRFWKTDAATLRGEFSQITLSTPKGRQLQKDSILAGKVYNGTITKEELRELIIQGKVKLNITPINGTIKLK